MQRTRFLLIAADMVQTLVFMTCITLLGNLLLCLGDGLRRGFWILMILSGGLLLCCVMIRSLFVLIIRFILMLRLLLGRRLMMMLWSSGRFICLTGLLVWTGIFLVRGSR